MWQDQRETCILENWDGVEEDNTLEWAVEMLDGVREEVVTAKESNLQKRAESGVAKSAKDRNPLAGVEEFHKDLTEAVDQASDGLAEEGDSNDGWEPAAEPGEGVHDNLHNHCIQLLDQVEEIDTDCAAETGMALEFTQRLEDRKQQLPEKVAGDMDAEGTDEEVDWVVEHREEALKMEEDQSNDHMESEREVYLLELGDAAERELGLRLQPYLPRFQKVR